MRPLISGVIGAAASSAAWLAFEHFQQQNYGWLVCLIGLVTGYCVHAGAKSAAGGTLRGAIAVLLTLAAIVGGQKVYARIMQATSTADKAVAVALIDPDDADGDDAEDADKGSADLVTQLPEPAKVGVVGKGGYSKSAMKKNLSEWDMVWMSLAALAAYITGKGGEKAAAVATNEQQPGEQPNDAGGEQDNPKEA